MKNLGLSIIPIVGVLFLSSSSHAFDLAGAWATDANVCPKISRGKARVFHSDRTRRFTAADSSWREIQSEERARNPPSKRDDRRLRNPPPDRSMRD